MNECLIYPDRPAEGFILHRVSFSFLPELSLCLVGLECNEQFWNLDLKSFAIKSFYHRQVQDAPISAYMWQ